MDPPAPKVDPVKSSEVIVTDKGENFAEREEDTKRNIAINIRGFLKPIIDFGEGDNFVAEIPELTLRIEPTSTPALPSANGVRPLEPSKEVKIKTPALEKVIFDLSKATPAEGKIESVIEQEVDVVEIPSHIDASAGIKLLCPWGSQKLKDGRGETEVHYACQITSKLCTRQTSCAFILSVKLSITLSIMLSGAGSAKYSVDGNPLPA